MNLISGKLAASRGYRDEGYRLPFDAALGAALDGRPLTFGIALRIFSSKAAHPRGPRHDVENHGVEKISRFVQATTSCNDGASFRPNSRSRSLFRFSWNPGKVVLFDGGSGMSLRHAGRGVIDDKRPESILDVTSRPLARHSHDHQGRVHPEWTKPYAGNRRL